MEDVEADRTRMVDADMVEGYRLFFGLSGMTLYAYPSYELFDVLYRQRIFAELPLLVADKEFAEGVRILQEWGASDSGELSQEEYHVLKTESTRLFAGTQSMEVIPWESAYFNKERMVFQRETLDVRAWYRTYGLQLVRYNQEPEDHIGLEMDFISRLLAQVNEALIDGRESEASNLLSKAKVFAAEHPLKWIDRWAAGVEGVATTPLYRGVAKVIPPALRAFISKW